MKKILLVILSVLFIILIAVVCLFIHFRRLAEMYGDYEYDYSEYGEISSAELDKEAEKIEVIYIDDGGEDEFGYKCPSALSNAIEKNPDVYGWLSITDTDITYPICNKPGNNSFYLNHSSNGAWNPLGALFTEDYNTRDFTDKCVVVYGHSMTGARFFGQLQKNFSNREFFDSHREIVVYLPDKMLTYTVFAALSYSNVHILHYFDFTSKSYFTWFTDSLRNVRSLDAIIDDETFPEFDDNILVLSTCLKGNNSKRFLVLAVLNDSEN